MWELRSTSDTPRDSLISFQPLSNNNNNNNNTKHKRTNVEQVFDIMGGWLIFIVLLLAIGLSFLGWVSAPKGDDQIVIRTSIIATITCCYLMWAIVYLAQLHPLIQPKRGDLRPEH
ncbi:hypothetical protein PCANC_15610 [Puccinia coronata f. sp. avenae]|uniref:V-type proton ATPase subunit n=1 Tax=Puccinia coronata f. sp. avenae TaxID=200324 RepID=A0A2N5SF50_9BASI|nr:hypothetical protein PCASD_21709 [Puccinia coronata f. sp. avenae]PLW13505.1 hypothetical protein PCANC_15610 [Puccinia coronata f. sp. avenae]PLW44705.1 hypothetical protein PCASD_05873 [Puccinia coronata f. sp. avenae]